LASSGYRKIDTCPLSETVLQVRIDAFIRDVFPVSGTEITGFIIDAKFVPDRCSPDKIAEAAGEEFILAVFRPPERQIVLSTSAVEISETPAKKDLWLSPAAASASGWREPA